MTPIKRFAIATAVVGSLLAGSTSVFAVGDNPYKDIVVRNAFALQPPPPPPTNAPPVPDVVPSNIVLTGVAKIAGVKRAFLTITTPGEKDAKYLTIGENERDSGIEVTSIDVKSGRVGIKKGGSASLISFETHGAKQNVVAAPPPGAPGAKPGAPGVPAPVVTGAPTVVTPQGGASTLPVSPNNTVVNPQRPTTTPLQTTDPNGGTRTVPQRPLRITPGASGGTSSTTTPAPNINPAAQAVQIEVNRVTQPSDFPPLPPTPLSSSN